MIHYGDVKTHEYIPNIESVTADQVSKVFAKILKEKVSFVCQGGNVQNLISYDSIQNKLSK